MLVTRCLHGWRTRLIGHQPIKDSPKQFGHVQKQSDIDTTIPALETSNVSVRFGGRLAVSNVSINVQQGEIVGLIGTNGAGKTTLMNAVSGFVPSEGEISLHGKSIHESASHIRARNG